MSAFDGAVQGRIIRGEQSRTFEGLPTLRGSISWSPDGRQIALVAISGGRDVHVPRGRGLAAGCWRRYDLHSDSAEYPAWSPVSRLDRGDVRARWPRRSLPAECQDRQRSHGSPMTTGTRRSRPGRRMGAVSRSRRTGWRRWCSRRSASWTVSAPTPSTTSISRRGAISPLVHTYGDDHCAGLVAGRAAAGVHLGSQWNAEHLPLRSYRTPPSPQLTDVLGRRVQPHLVASERPAGVLGVQSRRLRRVRGQRAAVGRIGAGAAAARQAERGRDPGSLADYRRSIRWSCRPTWGRWR